ncbi:Xaa-Pro aminopeptidase [Maritimibacter alkaliphilus HTCC2654]|uniref:Metallopeptidase, family M24 n=1 Tax=Maritimibacter alkaliphilus HTCC2654 TaxID=314271 RepID=A3VKQ1_9RHOB|nr:Xaa-Pro peptidase family protein [Maritimibacter alkaliphilus]EAQ11222.1 metallopeptidase, family M24 [Rhodobacterales bacterium HTCC2654] [Maritimibacter alkaliphilus HTCC2654]TYP83029.1 Xaa-Pro aminopeptidase [Maritimibacter alkaliphilus HTCC2654]
MTHPRGFPETEYSERLTNIQSRMAEHDLSALLLTTEPEVRYLTGFLTRFWESPTRPWFLVVPASGKPIAVIPEIGAHLMRQTWIDDIRTWVSPDYTDDGVSLLADTLAEVAPERGKIGVPSGPESHLRMPLQDWTTLRDRLPDRVFGDDAAILRSARMVKTKAEIAKIRWTCGIAEAAFARVNDIAGAGIPLSTVFRSFQSLLLDEGADWVPYLAGAAAPGGYGDVISPATNAPLEEGCVLMLDTGAVWDGYFCDFDRNFSIAAPSDDVQSAHARLIDATHAGFEAARPGATPAEVYAAMNLILTGGDTAVKGRLGHGLGMQLTEPPSLIPADHTPLVPGMVLTLEPVVETQTGIMVHEENIVVTEDGADWLTMPVGHAIPQVDP